MKRLLAGLAVLGFVALTLRSQVSVVPVVGGSGGGLSITGAYAFNPNQMQTLNATNVSISDGADITNASLRRTAVVLGHLHVATNVVVTNSLVVLGTQTNGGQAIYAKNYLEVRGTNGGSGTLHAFTFGTATSQLILTKDNGQVGFPFGVSIGDALGTLEFFGYGISDYRSGFRVKAKVLGPSFSDTEASTLVDFELGNNSASLRRVWGLSPYNWTNYVAAYFASNSTFSAGLRISGLTASRALFLNGAGDVTNATGTADSTTFLRGDGTYAVPAGGTGTGADTNDIINLLGSYAWSGGGANTNAPGVILVTDHGGDSDDAIDKALFSELHKLGLINLLAVTFEGTNDWGAPAISAVLHHYGLNVPVGVNKSSTLSVPDLYGSFVATNFLSGVRYYASNQLDAVPLIRSILARRPDSNTVIVTTGPLRTIQNLVDSTADANSGYAGPALLKRKLQFPLGIVSVAGAYTTSNGIPNGPNYNFSGDVGGAAWVNSYVENSFPVTWVGEEIGGPIMTGKGWSTNLSQNNPIYHALRLRGDTDAGRPAWAQVAAILVAYGTNLSQGSAVGTNVFGFTSGTNKITAGGSNDFWQGPYVGQRFLTMTAGFSNTLSAIIDSIAFPQGTNSDEFIPRSGGALINGGKYHGANGFQLYLGVDPSGYQSDFFVRNSGRGSGQTFLDFGGTVPTAIHFGADEDNYLRGGRANNRGRNFFQTGAGDRENVFGNGANSNIFNATMIHNNLPPSVLMMVGPDNRETPVVVGSGLLLTTSNLTATGVGSGDVVGPSASIDNSLVKFDLTTGKAIQQANSAILGDDSALSGLRSVSATNHSSIGTNIANEIQIVGVATNKLLMSGGRSNVQSVAIGSGLIFSDGLLEATGGAASSNYVTASVGQLTLTNRDIGIYTNAGSVASATIDWNGPRLFRVQQNGATLTLSGANEPSSSTNLHSKMDVEIYSTGSVFSVTWPSGFVAPGSQPIGVVKLATNFFTLVFDGTNKFVLSGQDLTTGTGPVVLQNSPTLSNTVSIAGTPAFQTAFLKLFDKNNEAYLAFSVFPDTGGATNTLSFPFKNPAVGQLVMITEVTNYTGGQTGIKFTNYPQSSIVSSNQVSGVLSNLTGVSQSTVTNENSAALEINAGTLTLSPGPLSSLLSSGIDFPASGLESNVIGVAYVDGLIGPASNLTNYTLTAHVAERTLPMTNAVRWTLLSGGTAGVKWFPCVTMTNLSGANQTLSFTNTWIPYGDVPTIITNGKTARVAFEVEGANVRYGVTYQR
jgi:hypothetical protein